MIDREMTDDQMDEQAAQYQGHRFSTCRMAPIRIDHLLPLRNALANLAEARDALDACRRELHMSNGDRYLVLKDLEPTLDEARDDQKAQVMAAFYRATGMWPYQLSAMGIN